jgi:hypothetical protein
MSSAVWVAAGIALLGAALTWLYLPAHALAPDDKRHLYRDDQVQQSSESL